MGPDADAELGELLDQELSFDATTKGQLSNHLPMALVALHQLGASGARLQEFASRYRDRLAPVPWSEPISTFDEWLSSRSRHGSYGASRAYLEAQVAAHGVDTVVRRHAPHLVDGLSGAAFHGIIRLAYALESKSDARVAAGLAYLGEVHQPLGPRGLGAAHTDDPVVALAELARHDELRGAAATGNIGQRMRQVARHPSFTGVVDWLEVSAATPERLTTAAVALYAKTDDFTALHGLTGSHAISIVAPLVEDREALSAWWFQALAAAYVTIGAPPLVEVSAELDPWLAHPASWETIASAAIASDDEHVVKLVYSAHVLADQTADPLCAAAAARQARVEPGS